MTPAAMAIALASWFTGANCRESGKRRRQDGSLGRPETDEH